MSMPEINTNANANTNTSNLHPSTIRWLSPTIAFLLVSFSLGELGDGLNIFQGIYLVGIGWNEGSVGTALSLMGLTSLLVQTWAGDLVDKTTLDRRTFLTIASLMTAVSASAILFVREGNQDHALIFVSKIVEGISASFIGPCLAALTLATFGPNHFDAVMASNILWGHIGSVVAAVLAGSVAYGLYPNIKLCFLVISAAALCAVFFVQYLPEGDPLMGRGFQGKKALDEFGHVENVEKLADNDDTDTDSDQEEQGQGQGQRRRRQLADGSAGVSDMEQHQVLHHHQQQQQQQQEHITTTPVAASYWDVIADRRSLVLCVTGFFFHFANANVLLVLGELMGGDQEDGGANRAAIPLIAGAIVLAQVTMAGSTMAGDKMTHLGVGRKPLFLAGLMTLPLRCALVIYWKDSGPAFLLSTQILDGLGGGFFGLLHPYLVADITFGTGRFNLLMGLTASTFGLGATMSNFLGQLAVESFGHVASLVGSLFLSFIPICIFACLMPETLGDRGIDVQEKKKQGTMRQGYVELE